MTRNLEMLVTIVNGEDGRDVIVVRSVSSGVSKKQQSEREQAQHRNLSNISMCEVGRL